MTTSLYEICRSCIFFFFFICFFPFICTENFKRNVEVSTWDNGVNTKNIFNTIDLETVLPLIDRVHLKEILTVSIYYCTTYSFLDELYVSHDITISLIQKMTTKHHILFLNIRGKNKYSQQSIKSPV